ncbi:MAG: hypothetical protein QXE31_02700 [Candidatus Woesearchaeota archaeon]
MALELPFMKKKKSKEEEIHEIEHHIKELDYDLRKLQNKLKSEKDVIKEKLDAIEKRLYEYEFLKVETDKKGEIVKKSGQEEFEKFQHRLVKTEFPKPERRFRIVLEYPNFNIEQHYYWFLRFISETWGFDKVEKVIDTMAYSVASSMFGNMQNRIGAQQAQVSQYLKGISDMIKGLFQMVRELRILDERLQYYYDSDGDPKGDKNSALSSEIVLKGLWIDQVEGGAKNPASVYGLANTIGFSVLPDLFFRVQVKDPSEIESTVDKLKFNAKVREVLKRKLRQYYEWKRRTKKELLVRRDFEIKYMKQHYETIRMYMSWVKPYLRNLRRLKLYEKNMDNPHIIQSFETQIIEIETLFIRQDFKVAYPVLSLHIFYRVKPELAYHSYEYQHKGPIYTGMADITLRAYAWDDKKIKNYIKYRQEDDIDLMTLIDKSVQDAMDALGDDLKKYLKEADPSLKFGDEKEEEKKEEKKKRFELFAPFMDVVDGFKEIFTSFSPPKGPAEKKPEKKSEKHSHGYKEHVEEHRAVHFAAEAAWETYYRYKMGPASTLYWVEA